MAAGNKENRAHIMVWTEDWFTIVTTVSPVAGSVPEIKPARPRSSATSAPDMAEPNFWDMVPEEKMRPVEEVPFFSVAKSATSAYMDQRSGEYMPIPTEVRMTVATINQI